MLSSDIAANDHGSDLAIQAEAKEKRSTRILSAQELGVLNQKSDVKGFLQLAGHLTVMAGSGYLWAVNISHLGDRLYIALPALVIYGFSLAIMFAPLHESSHRTAFANNQINDAVAWFAGLLSFYNSTFYRLYHKWHHRYTQLPGKDPELGDRKPENIREYVLEMSGINWWIGKFKGHFRVATGNLTDCPFIPEGSRAKVIRSTRLQLAVYGVAIAISIYFQQPWFLLYWVLPLAVGQPLLRLIMLAEHTDRPNTDDMLTNTRTTLTLAPLRFMLWNMSFHAEHHLYASIPFHQLAAAHNKLGSHFDCVENGYLNVHRQIVVKFAANPENSAV